MLKMKVFAVIMTAFLLSSCEFRPPAEHALINAKIVSSEDNLFAIALKKNLHDTTTSKFVIHVGAEQLKQRIASFTFNNQANSYLLRFQIAIKVFNNHEKLLLSEEFKHYMSLSRMKSTQADRLQITESYAQLRDVIIKQLLRKLAKLDAN